MNEHSHLAEHHSEPVYCPSCAARLAEDAPPSGTILNCTVCGTEFKYEPAQTSDTAITESDRPIIAAGASGPTRRPSTEEALLERLKQEPPKKAPLPTSTFALLFIAIMAVTFGIVHFASKPNIYAPGAPVDTSAAHQKDLFFQHIIDSLHTAIAANPGDTNLHLSLADAFYGDGKWTQSKQEFETYLAAKPFDANARVDYAYTVAQVTGNMNDGIAELDTVLMYKPDHLSALVNAGIMTAQTVNATNHATALARARNYFVRAHAVAEKTNPGIAARIDTLIQEIDNTGKRVSRP